MNIGVLIALIILGVAVIFSVITAISVSSRPNRSGEGAGRTVVFLMPNWAWWVDFALIAVAGIFMFLPLGTI